MIDTLTTIDATTMNAEQFNNYRAERDRDMVDKRGKLHARRYWQAVDRLFPVNDVVEYRANGVVIKSANGYDLHALSDTDSHHGQWRVGAVIDVSDQF